MVSSLFTLLVSVSLLSYFNSNHFEISNSKNVVAAPNNLPNQSKIHDENS